MNAGRWSPGPMLRTAGGGLHVTVGVVIAVLIARGFLAIGWLTPIVVAGDSMAPTLTDRALVGLVHRGPTPRRGDVVVARSPADARRLIVKRVVGLPGERVRVVRGEPSIDKDHDPGNANKPKAAPRNAIGELDRQRSVDWGSAPGVVWTLGPDEWFLAGDNRTVSIDSRRWGPVPARLIVGVARSTAERP